MPGERRVVAVTGGTGSGKSTFVAELAALGAHTIDVDALGRQVIEPDGRAYDSVISAFGREIVGSDGHVDRAALAKIVFSDPDQLRRLNSISHPAINDELLARLEALGQPGGPQVVVLDMAVLVESTLGQTPAGPMYDTVVVVEAPAEVRVERLVGRGLSEADARRRISSQASDEQRRAVADVVIDNSGGPDELASAARRFWADLLATAGDD